MHHDVFLGLISRGFASKPAPSPARPVVHVVGGQCARAHLAAGGVIVMQEIKPDGSPGIEWHVPPDEYEDGMFERFERGIRRKQQRRTMQLIR